MRESDELFLQRLRTEVEPALAAWATVVGLFLHEQPDGAVRIVLALDGRVGYAEIISEGASLIDAAAALPARIVEARLNPAFREIVLAPGT